MNSHQATTGASRHKARCDCAATYTRLTCAYCNTDLAPGSHEHDHFPTPASSGGTDTIPVCASCHSYKDRIDIVNWPAAMTLDALQGSPTAAKIMIAKLAAELHHQERQHRLITERLEDELRAAREARPIILRAEARHA